MKKRVFILLLCAAMMLSLTACNRFSLSLNTVGKDNTSVKKMARVIQTELDTNEKNGYNLYGVEMSMDTEDIGKAKLFYTNKLPQNLKYSDITVVTVDTRTGKIESVEDADFSSLGTTPYECIVDGAPIGLDSWKKDSDEALTIAQNTFYGEEDFVYNYAQISVSIKDEVRQYRVTFISFVNHLQYACSVDGMTGTVFDKEITEL